MSEYGILGGWFTKPIFNMERLRLFMCIALGLAFLVQYSSLYLILIDYWSFLRNGYIYSFSTFVIFSFGVWFGGLMLWKNINPMHWLDYGYRIKLPNMSFENKIAAEWWCDYNLTWSRWRILKNGDFLFANGKQAMYFKIKWMNAQRVKLYDF